MAVDILKIMQSKYKTPWEFNFDHMFSRPLLSYLTIQDIEDLRKIATSIKLSGNIKKKQRLIGDIMSSRGFRRFAGGTNRLVFACYEDTSILIKVATDRVGMRDNPDELRAQYAIKPFCSKMYEVSPCGTVGLCERVIPIKNIQQFKEIAEDVFEIISRKIVGKYVMDDIGSEYFLNWGIRPGFGPVLVDFPYLYDLDGDKLFCNKILEDGSKCCGEIDYDIGFNHLYCQKCGKMYKAIDLKSDISQNKVIIGNNIGGLNMRIKVITDGKTIAEVGSSGDNYMRPTKVKSNNQTPSVSVIIDGKQYGTDVENFNVPSSVETEETPEVVTKTETVTIPDGFEIEEDEDTNVDDMVSDINIDNITNIDKHDINTITDNDEYKPEETEINISEEITVPDEPKSYQPTGNSIVTKKASYITKSTGIKINSTKILSNENPAQASRKDMK